MDEILQEDHLTTFYPQPQCSQHMPWIYALILLQYALSSNYPE